MTISEMEPIVITSGGSGGTPSAHAPTHASGGSDPVTLAQSQVTGLTAALTAKATDTAVVHLAGTETIAGSKIFSNPIAIGTNPATVGIIRIPNSQSIYARNAANTGDLILLFLDGANNVHLGDAGAGQTYIKSLSLTMADPGNIVCGFTTGTKVATAATQKLAFYGAAPVVRPTATPAAAVDPATTMALVNDLRAKLITLGLIA
jgi:hypothetical protein